MPAIQPSQLKCQIDELCQYYHSPYAFVDYLKELFEFYADRTRRLMGHTSKSSLVRTYNVPRQVSKQIEIALQNQVKSEPETGIIIADYLWQESWLECRSLAFLILGWISPNPTIDIAGRLLDWCKVCGYDRTMDTAIARGITELWRGLPDYMSTQLESWLASSDPVFRKWGLRVVQALVSDPAINNLPIIFRLLTPFVQSVNVPPDTDLLFAVRSLAEQNPQETAFFLRRNLTASENDGIYTLIRQSLDSFTSPIQEDLRDYLHQMRDKSGEY